MPNFKLKLVHQCWFCPQTFENTAEKNHHVLEHFSQETCIECNQHLILIGDTLYIKHDATTCIKERESDELLTEAKVGLNGQNDIKVENMMIDSIDCTDTADELINSSIETNEEHLVSQDVNLLNSKHLKHTMKPAKRARAKRKIQNPNDIEMETDPLDLNSDESESCKKSKRTKSSSRPEKASIKNRVIPKSVRNLIPTKSMEEEEFIDRIIDNPAPETVRKKRCRYCNSKINRKTRTICTNCGNHVCREHLTITCVECKGKSLSRTVKPEHNSFTDFADQDALFSSTTQRRRRCKYCHYKIDRKTKTVCSYCGNNVCREHLTITCIECDKLSIKKNTIKI